MGDRAGGGARTEVTFDYAWLFRAADDTLAPQCDAQWTTNLTAHDCTGLVYTAQGRIDPNDCMKACCADPSCNAWQWQRQQWRLNKGGCYHNLPPTGYSCTPNASSTWVGGARAAAPPLPNYPSAAVGLDDSTWLRVDAPHDFVAAGRFDAAAQQNHGYLPRNVSWYRKHFTLPSTWASGATWVAFDGVFHRSQWWLNGRHVGTFTSGYVPFTIDLSGAHFGPSSPNVLAVRVDASYGSGHWYEGGGIYRPTKLVHTEALHVAPDGLFARTSASRSGASTWQGTAAPSVTVFNNGSLPAQATATFTLYDAAGAAVGSAGTAAAVAVPAHGGVATLEASTPIVVAGVALWSVQTPTLYTMSVELSSGDAVTAAVGFREAAWSADDGFALNGRRLELRGFSNHNSFAGQGVAVAPRVDLFKAQGYRAMGANVQRMSHNPPVAGLLGVLDALGVLVWDEARDFGPQQRYVNDMAAMVRRDRNHPSVVVWSVCNEIECHEATNDTGTRFRAAAKQLDPTRPVTANTVGTGIPSEYNLFSQLDVLGLSHRPLSDFEQFHAQRNTSRLPLVASESSSCMTQRGMNNANVSAGVFFPAFDGPCLVQCLNKSYDAASFIAGTLGVWTAHDYIGEPGSAPHAAAAWPHASSSFGQIDLAGFNKPHSAYYRAWWLAGVPQDDAGRPPLPPSSSRVAVIAEVLDARQPPSSGIHVFSGPGSVELLHNGVRVGAPQQVPTFGWAEFNGIAPVSGNLTAIVRDSSGSVTARHTRLAAGDPAGIVLSVDAPSPMTGTGSALVLDGHDAALVRATVVDSRGVAVEGATGVNITFSVASGPGHVVGTGCGNPANHDPITAAWHRTSAGLARAVVRVNVDAVSPHRSVLRGAHAGLPAALGPRGNAGQRSVYVATDEEAGALLAGAGASIVVRATAPGMAPAEVSIPVSTDEATHGVLAVAAASTKQAAWPKEWGMST